MKIVQPSDLSAAIDAARVKNQAIPQMVEALCGELNRQLHSIITSNRGLETAQATLTRLERGAKRDPAALRTSRSHANVATSHPLSVALHQAVEYRRLLDPEWTISNDLKQSDLDLAELAAIAETQYRIGINNTKKRISRESRLRGQSFGHYAIWAYCQLTGRPAARSESPETRRHLSVPTGPLIRFLRTFYTRLRSSLQTNGLARPASARSWSLDPADATFVRWIRFYKSPFRIGLSTG